MTEYILELDVDGVKKAGVAMTEKPALVALTLSRVDPVPSVVTVLGSREIVIP